MKRTRWPFLLTALALAACAQESASVADEDAEAAALEDIEEPQRLTPVDTAVEAPSLAALSRTDLEAELEAGAGCHIEQDGRNLLTAIEGDAIARPYGTLRHFEFDGDLEALWDGGAFTAGAITVIVEPADVEGEQIEEVNVRPARVVVRETGIDSEAEMRAEWQCGS